MTCSTYTDYSARRNCPLYDLDNCPTPDAPILCPLLENSPRSPCVRYICSTDTARSTTLSSTSTTTSSVASRYSTIGAFVLPLIQSTTRASNDEQVFLIFNICYLRLLITLSLQILLFFRTSLTITLLTYPFLFNKPTSSPPLMTLPFSLPLKYFFSLSRQKWL